MGSVIGFNACGGDPYKDLKVTLSETSLSLTYDTENDENNIFELTATVSGGDSDISRGVIFSSSNENIVSLIEGSQVTDGNKTTAKFILVNGENAIITARSAEKASVHAKCEVAVEVGVSKIEFYGNTLATPVALPIELGVKTDIIGKFGTNVAGRIKFTPDETNQRNVILKAYTLEGVLLEQDAVKIEGNHITVLSEALNEFKLYAESVANSALHDEIVVKVLRPITNDIVSALSIGADDPAGASTEMKSSIVGGIKTFDLNLANNVVIGSFEDRKNVVFSIEDMDVTEIENLYSFTLQTAKPSSFNVRGADGTSNVFLFEQGDGNASEEVSVFINYKGYEKYFQNKEVKIRVNVSAFADNILITKLNETEAKESYNVYKNYSNNANAYAMYGVDYKGLALNVKAQSDNKTLHGQKVRLVVRDLTANEYVTDGSFMILNESGLDVSPTTVDVNGEPVFNNLIYSGENVYVRYDYNKLSARGLEHNYVLIAVSDLYAKATSYGDDITAQNRLNIINQDIYASITSEIAVNLNGEYLLTREGLSQVGDIDEIVMRSEDPSLVSVKYDEAQQGWVLTNTNGKLGSTKVWVATPNGYTAYSNIVVWQETNIENLKLKFGNKIYDATTEEQDPAKLYLICGSVLNVSYIIDGVEYPTSTGGMKLTASEYEKDLVSVSLDCSQVSIGRIGGETPLTFTFVNLHNDETLYFKFELNITKPISEFYLDPTAENKLNIIPSDATNVEELEEQKTGYFTLIPNPNDATINPDNVDWGITYGNKSYSPKKVIEELHLVEGNSDVWAGKLYFVLIENKFTVTVTYKINETSRQVSVEYTATKDASEKNNAFSLFIAYAQTYYTLDGNSYSLNIGNYGVQIIVEDIVTATSITPSMNVVTFNKYQLTKVSDSDDHIIGVEDSNKHIQTITYSILPNKNMTYPGIVTLDASKNPMDYDETKEVYFVTGTNGDEALYHLSIDEKLQRVTITLNYGYSSLDNFDFYIATKDSIQEDGMYRIFTKIEVVIAQGTVVDPYKVSDAVDLQFMNYDLEGCYQLQNNIYLNDFEFTPIGTIEKPFVGHLDGKGMFVTGLDATYDVKQNENEIATYGLFGYIKACVITGVNHSVINLTIKNFNIVADYTNADTPKDIYVGALAGYLGGSVENITILDNDTTNYSKIDGALVNEIHKGGVNYIGSSNNSLHNVFVGGLAGVVVTSAKNIKVNTFINFADEDDDKEGKGSHTYVGGVAGAVVSGSIVNNSSTLTDVNVVIKNTTTYFTKKTYVGGVVGANQGTINHINARTVVLANNNVGGFAGINTGTIQNSTVQPTVYGKENVGGFAAVNAWGKQSELDDYVYFNTLTTNNNTNSHIECITGNTTNKFYGTIVSSKVVMLDQLDRISMFNTSVYGENNVGGFVGLNHYSEIDSNVGSAKYASMTSLASNISYSSVKTYFGVNKDSVFATRRSISTSYAKDNIEGLYYGDVVVNGGVAGGFIGYAKDLSLINNYSHVNITSMNSESVIGGLAGVVSGYLFVNATPVLGDVNGEATLVGGFIGDASGVATIEHAHDFFDATNSILSYKTEITSEHLTKGINNSYTLLTRGGEYVQNFVGAGEFYEGVLNQDVYILKIDVEGTKATYSYFKDGAWISEIVENTTVTQDTYYLGSVMVKVPRIFVSNTFYIGYTTVNNSGTSLEFTLDNAKNPEYYPTTDGASYSNLRHYEVKFFDYTTGVTRPTEFSYNNDGISVTYTQETKLLSDSPYIKNPIEGNTASYYVVEDDKVDIGLNGTYPTNQTYYLNSTVNGGFPVPFAKAPISGSKPNLVYDIAPESIKVEYIDGYFAVNEPDPTDKKLTLEYDVEKPLFEGQSKDLEYKDLIDSENKIKPNVYCLTNKSVLGLSIKPEFVKNGKVVFTSSNPDLAQVIVEGENVYLAVKGIGNVNIYISSSYNLGINEVVSLQIYKKISSFELMTKSFNGNDYITMGDSHELIRNHTTTIYPALNGSRENLNNIGFEITSNVATSGNLFVNGQDVFGTTLRVDSSLFGLNAKQEFSGVNLTIKPYMTFVIDGKTYVKYINHEKTITLNSINGTFGINGPEDFTFPVTNNEEFEIVLTTDSVTEWLELNVAVGEEKSKYLVFEDNGNFDVLLVEGDNLASILDFSIISTTAGDGTFTYNIGVNLPRNNYSYITKDTTFNVSVGLKNNVHNVDPYEFDIVVIPQQVQSVVINHYTDMVYSDGANPDSGQYETYKYPSSSVIPGYTSLITLDVNPSYAQLDRVVVSMSHTSADIEQLVEVSQTSNGYSLFQKYPDYDKDYLTKQIIVRNLVSTANNTYNGKLYFGLHVDSTLNDANIVINFKGYVNGRDGSVFDKDLTLNVVAMPNVQLKFVEDGLAELPVAAGTSVDFTITASNFDALTFNTDSLAEYGQLSTAGDGTYTFTFNENYKKQHEMLYNYIEITATAKRTLTYGVYSRSSTIKMMTVPFVVRGIEINGAEDGKIKGYFNQIKELSASLVTEYSEAYNAWLESSDKDTVTDQVDALNKQMNYAVESGSEVVGDINDVYNYYKNSELVYSNLFKTSPSADGITLTNLQGRAYNDFVIRMLPDSEETKTVTSIQFTKLDMHTYIVASVNIVYLKNGTTLISFGGGAGGENVIVKEVRTTVIGDIKSISDEDYPDPITSVDDFLDMNRYQSEKDPKDRGNFILLNDLVLTNWVPMPAYFNSLDGNGYTITIMSFAKMEDMTSSTNGAKIGLFSTVGDSSNTYVTIKNLTVEINAGVVGETSGDVILNENHTLEINATDKNNMASHTNITFGVVAAENYGTITNTVVTNRATDLRNQRKEILKQQVELGYVEMENLQDFKKYLETFDKEEDTSLDAVDVVYLNSGKNTETKGNIIGGLVGSNKGYITNSNVENVSIKGSDMVGGFVGENSGKISSSYFKGASIIDTDSNSANSNSIGLGGFVANNTTSGIIQYCYVNGIEGFKDPMPNTGLGTLERSDFVGSKYSEKADLNFLRSMNSAIYTQTNAGGFAYKNDGIISNSYSNILVSAQSGAGFALDNDGGTIEYSYSMSSVKLQGANDVPFTKDGNVKDSYYLKVDATDLSSTDLDKVDEFSNENESLGTSLNASQFADYNSFTSFAFNTDYHDNKEITSSVWFIPREYNPFADGAEIEGSFQGVLAKYFRNNYYTINRPELVSPNLKTLSIRYYCKEETTGTGDKDDKGYYYNLVETIKYDYVEDDKTQNPVGIKVDPEGAIEKTIARGSLLNPLLINDGDSFNKVITTTAGEDKVNKNNFRIIKDVTFNNLDQTAKTHDIVFSGNLDGNGMTIENLHIESDPSLVTSEITTFGMFSKVAGVVDGTTVVKNTGVVHAVNINIEEINGANVNLVGVLAGQLENAKIYNVKVDGSPEVNVQGLNAVGGIAGLATGKTEMINIESNVSVNATLTANKNLFRKYNYNAKDTTFEVYNGLDLTDGNNNIKEVCYAGGVVGIFDVEKNPGLTSGNEGVKNLDRMRTVKTYGSIKLQGQVVGGITGYVGKTSAISNVYVEIDTDAHFVASRIGGGIVGHNEGKINRAGIYHSNQATIDKSLLSSSDRYENPTSDITVTGSYPNLFGYVNQNSNLNSNAHFIGGIVGFNNGNECEDPTSERGIVTNSYSRVDVVSQDAMYAGGVIGLNIAGKLNTIYTTGSVFGVLGTGGIIGIQANYNEDKKLDIVTVNNTKEAIKKNIISNSDEICPTEVTDELIRTDLGHIIGANIWTYSHTNTIRAHYNINANPSHIGMLAGYVMGANEDSKVGTYYESAGLTSRVKGEDIYFKQTFAYGNTAQILKEVGNINRGNDMEGEVPDFSNAIKQFDKIALISGYSSDGDDSYYKYSRLGDTGSLRTLKEFLNRIGSNDGENKFLTRFTGEELTGEKPDSGIINHPRIYYAWDRTEWAGTELNESNVKIEAEYAFPGHTNRVEAKVIYVYTEEDLRLMNEYSGAEFILMNDITLTRPWEPVGNLISPFRGILRSNDADGDGTLENYKIKGIEIDSKEPNVGFIAISNGAKVRSIKFEFDSFKAENVNASDSSVGMLIGRALGSLRSNLIENISITCASQVVMKDYEYNGGFVGAGDRLILTNNKISGIKLQSFETKVDKNYNINFNFGWIAGNATLTNNLIQEKDAYGYPVYTEDGNPKLVEAGHVGNVVENCGLYHMSGSTEVKGYVQIDARNPHEDKVFSGSTLYVGGLFGNLVSKTATETFLDKNVYKGQGITIQIVANDIREKEIETVDSKGRPVKEVVSTQAYCNEVAVGGIIGNIRNLGIKNLSYVISTDHAVNFINGMKLNEKDPTPNGFVARRKGEKEIVANTYNFSLGGLIGYANMCDIDGIDALVAKTVTYTNSSLYECKVDEKTGALVGTDVVVHNYNLGLLIGGFVSGSISEKGLTYIDSDGSSKKHLNVTFEGNGLMPETNFGVIGYANTSEIQKLLVENYNLYYSMTGSYVAQDTKVNGGGLIGYAYDTQTKNSATDSGELMVNGYADKNSAFNLGGIVGYMFGGGKYEGITTYTAVTQLANSSDSVYVGGFVGKIGEHFTKVDEDDEKPEAYTYNFNNVKTRNYILNENLFSRSEGENAKLGIGGFAGGVMYYSTVNIINSEFNSNIGYTYAMGESSISQIVFDIETQIDKTTSLVQDYRIGTHYIDVSSLHEFFKNTTYKGGVIGYTGIEKKDYIYIGGEGNIIIDSSTVYNGDLIPYSSDWGTPVSKNDIGNTSRGNASSYKSVIVSERTRVENYGTVLDSTNMTITANYGAILFSKVLVSANNKETGFVFGSTIEGATENSTDLICNTAINDVTEKPEMFGNIAETTVVSNAPTSLDGVCAYLNNVILQYSPRPCNYIYIGDTMYFIKKPVGESYPADDSGNITVEVFTDENCKNSLGDKIIPSEEFKWKEFKQTKYIYYLFAGNYMNNYIVRTDGSENGLYKEETQLVSSFMYPKTYKLENITLEEGASAFTYTKERANDILSSTTFDFENVWMKMSGINDNRVGFMWMFKKNKFDRGVGAYKVDEDVINTVTKSNPDYFKEINTPEKLLQLSYAVNNDLYSGSAALTADINMSGYIMEPIGKYVAVKDDKGKTENLKRPFIGGFNGNGHKISNLTVVSTDYSALFGYVQGNGQTFENVLIENSTFINTQINESNKIVSQLINTLDAAENSSSGSVTLSQIGLRYNDMFSVIKGAKDITKQSAFIGITYADAKISIDNSYAIMYSVDYGDGVKTIKDSVINSWSKGTTLTLEMTTGYVGAVEYGVKTRDKSYKETPTRACITDFLIDAVSMESYSNYTSTHAFTFTNVYGTGDETNGLSSSFELEKFNPETPSPYKDLVQLKHNEIAEITPMTTEELCGFDWHTVWTRDPNANNSLPILTHNGLYWKDFAKNDSSDLQYSSGVVTIKTPEGLAHLSNIVNGTAEKNDVGNVAIAGVFYNPDVIKNATIVINNDINLGGKFWTPIGTEENPFFGSFNGTGKTISNLTTMGQYGEGLSYTSGYSGLFGVVARKSATPQVFKDVKLANIAINDRRTGGLIAKMDVSNVFIPDAGSTPGGAVTPTVLSAADATEYSATITNIVVDGGQIKGIYTAAGIVGEVKGNVHISHSKNSANISEYIQNIGTYNSETNPAGYDLTKTTYLGGIAGFAGPDVEIFNVANSGNVVSKTTDALANFKVGGIVGHAYGANIDTALMSGYVSVQKESINGTNSSNGIGGIVGNADNTAIIQNVKLEAYDSDGDVETKEETPAVYGVYNTGGLVGIMENASLYEGAVFGIVDGVGSNYNAYFVGKFVDSKAINLYSPHSENETKYLFGNIQNSEYSMTVSGNETQILCYSSGGYVSEENKIKAFKNTSAWVENGEKWVLNEFGRTYNPNQPLSNETDKENLAVNYIPGTSRLESDVEKQYEVSSEADLLALNNWYNFRYGFDYKFGIKFMNDITITTDIVVGVSGKYYAGTQETHAKVSADSPITITYQLPEGQQRTSGLFGNIIYVDFNNINVKGNIVTDIDRVGGLVNEAYECKFTNISSSVTIKNTSTTTGGATGGIVGLLTLGASNGVFTNCSYIGTYDGSDLTIDSICSISGKNNVGGLIGCVNSSNVNDVLYNKIDISNSSVSKASIRGTDYVGGLIGGASGSGLDVTETNVKVENVTIDFTGIRKDSDDGWLGKERFGEIVKYEILNVWSTPNGKYRSDFADEDYESTTELNSIKWYGVETSEGSGNGETSTGWHAPNENNSGNDDSVYYTTFGCAEKGVPSISDKDGVKELFSEAKGISSGGYNATLNVGLLYGFKPENVIKASVDNNSKITSTTSLSDGDNVVLDRFVHWFYIAIEDSGVGDETYANGLAVLEYTYQLNAKQLTARKYDFIDDIMSDHQYTYDIIKIEYSYDIHEITEWSDWGYDSYTFSNLSVNSESITEKRLNKVTDLFTTANSPVISFIKEVEKVARD